MACCLSGRWGLFDAYKENILSWYLGVNRIEKSILSKIPLSIFPTAEERFYVVQNLTMTIDWVQYYELLYIYNSLLENYTFVSNQLGGLDTRLRDTSIVTGIPAFFEQILPRKSIPFEVCSALLSDGIRNDLSKLAGADRTRIRAFVRQAKKSVLMIMDQNKVSSTKQEISLMFLNQFALLINKDRKLITRICFAYWQQFEEYFEKEITRTAKELKEESQFLNIPDCYFLVEGISDKTVYSHFLKLYAEHDITIKVVECRSKDGVYRRFRDLINNESYVGSIVTVLDSDATKEYNDMHRMNTGNLLVRHFIYPHGTLEDIFSIRRHVKVLNKLYHHGERIESSDLRNSKRIEAAIKKALWEKKTVNFDKSIYANAMIQEFINKRQIPVRAKEIICTAIEVARTRSKELPRLKSHISIDRLSSKIDELLY